MDLVRPRRTADELYRECYPNGHQSIRSNEWEKWTGADASAMDERTRLLFTALGALAAPNKRPAKRESTFRDLEELVLKCKTPEWLMEGYPDLPLRLVANNIIRVLADALSSAVSMEIIIVTTDSNTSQVRFARANIAYVETNVRLGFIEKPSSRFGPFSFICVVKPKEESADSLQLEAPEQTPLVRLAPSVGGFYMDHLDWESRPFPAAVTPDPHAPATFGLLSSLAGWLKIFLAVLIVTLVVYGVGTVSGWVSWVGSGFQWVASSVGSGLQLVTSSVATVGVGTSVVAQQMIGAVGGWLSQTQNKTARRTQESGTPTHFKMATFVLPELYRREVDSMMPRIIDVLDLGGLELEKAKMLYGVGVMGLGIDDLINELAVEMQGAAGNLSQSKMGIQHNFNLWHEGAVSDLYNSWNAVQQFTRWHQESSFAKFPNGTKPFRYPWHWWRRKSLLEADRVGLVAVTRYNRDILRNTTDNRTAIRVELEGTKGNLSSAIGPRKPKLLSPLGKILVPLENNIALAQQRTDKTAEGEQLGLWKRVSRYFGARDNHNEVGNPDDSLVQDCEACRSPERLDDALIAFQDLESSFCLASEIVDQIYITVNIDVEDFDAEVDGLRELWRRAEKLADVVAAERDPSHAWLQGVSAETKTIIQLWRGLLEHYHVRVAEDVKALVHF